MSTGDPIQLAAALYIAEKWAAKWQALEPNLGLEYFVCGSIRRKAKMVRDIDILVLDEKMHGTFERGTKFEGVELNLCFVRKECEGSAKLFLTGDAAFNIRMRGLAKSKKMLLNRYGLWWRTYHNELIHSATEEGIFQALDIDYVEPEHRGTSDGQKGISIRSTAADNKWYEVFIREVHGYNFCGCKGFQYRQSCKHLKQAEAKV